MTTSSFVKPGSFYVTLPSTASINEFPNNKAHSFKVRLPQRLELQGPHWKVALSGVTIPDTTDTVLVRLGYDDLGFPDNERLTNEQLKTFPLFEIWGYTAKKTSTRVMKTTSKKLFRVLQETIVAWEGSTGETFMHAFVNYMNNQFTYLLSEAHKTGNHYYPIGNLEYHDAATHLSFVPKIYVENKGNVAEVVVDNKNLQILDKHHPPTLKIRTDLALKMGWIVRLNAGKYDVGPNLLISDNGKGYINQNIGGAYTNYVEGKETREPEFSRILYDQRTCTVELSPLFNWRFTNLNTAYDKLRGHPARTLMIYSDVAASSIVGGQITDLLREVPYNRQERGTMYIEPWHYQFRSIRSNIMETIEISINEQNGTFVAFDSHKPSSVTLVFQNEL